LLPLVSPEEKSRANQKQPMAILYNTADDNI